MQGPQHLLADIQCKMGLSDPLNIQAFILALAKTASLTIRHLQIQEFANGSKFGPGITGIAILSESHIALHTTPERHYLNLDVFSCKELNAEAIWLLLGQYFGVERVDRWDVLRRHE